MNELLALALLIGFVLGSVLVIAAGGTRLHRLWWVGSLAGGAITAAMLGSSPLEFPNVPAIMRSDVVAPVVLGIVGFLAATDVQVVIGFVVGSVIGRGRGGIAPVIAGTILGPIAILAGAAFLGSVLG